MPADYRLSNSVNATSPSQGVRVLSGREAAEAVQPRRGTRRRDTGMSAGAAGSSAVPADGEREREAPDSASKAQDAREQRKRPARRRGGMFSE